MRPPRFAVVGTGRCGTGYMAQLLGRCGMNVGHEDWWNPNGHRQSGLDGDCSWLAVPHLETFDGPVLHQVRHPLAVIGSLVGIRFFTDDRHGDYRRYALEHMPELAGLDDLDAAMRWWVVWNRRSQYQAALTYRVEQVDADLMYGLMWLAGSDGLGVTTALEATPHDVNSRKHVGLTWESLPPGPWADDVKVLAEEYGYA